MLDYRTQLEASLWNILETDAAFAAAVKVGLRQKESSATRATSKVSRTAVGSYPQVEIEAVGSPSTFGASTPRTFGMNSASFSSSDIDFSVPITQQFSLTITYDFSRQKTSYRELESIVEKILWSAWPKFDLAYVVNATWTISRKAATEKQKPQTIFLITFNLRPMLSTLTA